MPRVRARAPAVPKHQSRLQPSSCASLGASREPLRVLHVVEACGGGVFEVLDTLTRGLAYRGHTNAIAYGVRPETPADLPDRLHESVELIPLPWIERRPIALVSGLASVPGAVRRWNPDVVHLHSSFAGATSLLPGISVPTVYTPHGYAFLKPRGRFRSGAIKWAERAIARRVSVIAATSHSEASQAFKVARAPRVRVVKNGIAELDNPENHAVVVHKERLILGIGRPVPQRQPVAAAKILQSLSGEADVRWIGGGYDSGAGIAALHAASVPVTGWLPREEALSVLRRSMVYLHWTAWDGLALSVLEALALDVIVVAYDIPPSREILGSQQVCATTSEAVSLIRKVLTDEPFRQDLIVQQRQRRAQYSARSMVENCEATYLSVRARSPRGDA
jgi:glycosyltransferase involved in cell wall biosynthesis